MFGENEIRLSPTWIVPLKGVRSMQEDDHVGILFEGIMQIDAVGDEIVCLADGSVIHVLFPKARDFHDRIPVDIGGCKRMYVWVIEHDRRTMQPRPARR